MTLRAAWDAALYGPHGFYRTETPRDHFRTATHGSPVFAAALVELCRRHEVTQVWDVGAGEGELLEHLRSQAPDLTLTGIELRARPASLPGSIRWRQHLPSRYDGLVVANELLDTVPCEVVELDHQHAYRVVEVDVATGAERLGGRPSDDDLAWISRWWPLTHPGERAEVGRSRDKTWARICAGAGRGICLAVDYGHLADSRPPGGSLSSYRAGTQLPVSWSGDCDVTAHVAFDALQSAAGGEMSTQREALHTLGVRGGRPPLALATSDPRRYLRELSSATEAAELTAVGGFGDFSWLLSRAQARYGSGREAPPPSRPR